MSTQTMVGMAVSHNRPEEALKLYQKASQGVLEGDSAFTPAIAYGIANASLKIEHRPKRRFTFF